MCRMEINLSKCQDTEYSYFVSVFLYFSISDRPSLFHLTDCDQTSLSRIVVTITTQVPARHWVWGRRESLEKSCFVCLGIKKKREKRKSGVVLKTDTESAGYFNWGLLLLSLVFLDCVISLWQDWAQSDRTVLVIWHKDQACLTKWCHHDVWFGLI